MPVAWRLDYDVLSPPSLPTRGEVVLGLRRMTNAKVMGPDNLPADLLNLGVRASSRRLAAFQGTILRIWQEQTVPQLWKDAAIQVLHKKKYPTECVISGESPWLRMRERLS